MQRQADVVDAVRGQGEPAGGQGRGQAGRLALRGKPLRIAAIATVLNCRIEIPKGSRNKYEWNERLGGIKLDRFRFSSVAYPTDYGFIPETIADDGDALDAIVCVSAPTFPGCVIKAKPIALFRTHDEGSRDDKVLCVPCEDPGWSHIEGLNDVPRRLRDEIAHFFSIYKQPRVTPSRSTDGGHETRRLR